ncbi:MAG TPA: AAA family ATPase [Thermomicrobiales bacterium]|nr:AAA family ATPase [Thermomicrobiales bacterium]
MNTPTLHIRLLGAADIRTNAGETVPVESARAASLLAYLLLHQDAPQSRQRLAFLLWPDSTESQARTNLRHVVHTLRRAVPDLDAFVEVTPHTLRWNAASPHWLDVAEFNQLLETARGNDGDALSALRQAVDLYRGELLEGSYEEWLLSERELLSLRFRDALIRIASILEQRGQPDRALPYAERLLRHDPLDESACRLLMRLHDLSGDRARAMRVYHECAAVLERELGGQPSELTLAAYQSLLPVEREHAPTRGSGPELIGRRQERQQLTDLWRRAARGSPNLVVLAGEAGVGKTRLVEELASWCLHQGAVVASARAYAAEGALAFGPVVSWLRAPAVWQLLPSLAPAILSDLARVLPELSDLPGVAPPELLPARDYRQRVFDAMARALLSTAEPLLLVADDLHWFDIESLQFLHYLLRSASHTRLLVAGTVRDEELDPDHPVGELVAGLRSLDRYIELAIDRLDRDETLLLASALVDRSISDTDADALYRETEGNPLFVVETIRAGWQHAGTDQPSLSPRVQSVIQSRLLQLSSAGRELVAVAATIGRAFSADVLRAAAAVDDDTLVQALDELWRRRIIDEQGADAYDFTHDKIREAAYQDMSAARRRQMHARVASALERVHHRDASDVSGQIASHYDLAGDIDRAVSWYERAAEASQQRHSNAEAVRQLRRAVDLLRSQPETYTLRLRELKLLTALPSPLVAVDGYQSPFGSEVHERALVLSDQLGVELEPPLLWSMAVSSLPSGDFATAHHYGSRLRAIGERAADDVVIVQSEYVLGITAYWGGELVDACAHFEAVIERFDPRDRNAHLLRFGQDPYGICQMRLAFTYWFLGRTADAIRARDQAVAGAAAHAYWFNRLSVLHFAGLLAIELDDRAFMRECVSFLVAVREDYVAAYIERNADALTGYLDILDGRASSAIAAMERSFDSDETVFQMPGQWSTVARVLLAARTHLGEPHAGLAAANRLLSARDGVRFWEAEARRMRAEFMLALGVDSSEVEKELDLALAVARRQRATALELRVAISMVRCRSARGDTVALSSARELLAHLVDALSDGSDTADLRDAISLLSST